MKVRYSPWIATVYLLLGVGLFGLSIWLMGLTGQFQPGILIGPLIAVLGMMMYSRPYVEIDKRNVVRLALVGSRTRVTTLAVGEQLISEGSRLYILTPSGERRRVRVATWLAHPGDWRAVTTALAPQASP